MIESAAFDFNFNVIIKVVDKRGKTVDVRKVHNKANRSLVDGMIQFLQGSFNPSEFNDPYVKYSNPEQAIITNALAAKRYIPSCTGMGWVGVSLTNHALSIDSSQFAKPNFFEKDLQVPFSDINRLKFGRVRPTQGFDQNNSLGISLTTILPKGYLVIERYDSEGFPVFRNNYFKYYGENGSASPDTDPWVHAMAVTEVGLFSNTDPSQSLLLARVLLNGELAPGTAGEQGVMADPTYPYNPLIQTEETSVVIEWRLDIISIGAGQNPLQSGIIGIPTEVPEQV